MVPRPQFLAFIHSTLLVLHVQVLPVGTGGWIAVKMIATVVNVSPRCNTRRRQQRAVRLLRACCGRRAVLPIEPPVTQFLRRLTWHRLSGHLGYDTRSLDATNYARMHFDVYSAICQQ